MDSLFKLLTLLLEPFLDYVKSSVNIVVSLNGQATFKEDDKGVMQQQSGSAVILVINHGKEPLKVQEVGIVMKDGQRIVSPWLLDKDQTLPRTVNGKDHTYFLVNRDALLKIGLHAIDSIKYVYLTDSVFREYKSRVPKVNKMQIVASLQNRIRVV